MNLENKMPIGGDHQSIAQKVYLSIKKLILSGELRAGMPVSEVELAAYLDVSRTPVREALRELAHQGLVHNPSRKRAVVAAVDEEDAKAIARVRIAMEKLACELLIENGVSKVDFETLEAMAENCLSYYQAGDIAEAVEGDSMFHLELARQSGNRHLFELLLKFDPKIQLLRQRQRLPLKRKLEFIAQHKEIIALLRDGDGAGLYELLKRHIGHDLSS